jgi:hypothetical protein
MPWPGAPRCAGAWRVGNVVIASLVGAEAQKPTSRVGNVKIYARPGTIATFCTRDPGRRPLSPARSGTVARGRSETSSLRAGVPTGAPTNNLV